MYIYTIYMCIYAYIYTIYICMYTDIYIYVHIYIFTHIHISFTELRKSASRTSNKTLEAMSGSASWLCSCLLSRGLSWPVTPRVDLVLLWCGGIDVVGGEGVLSVSVRGWSVSGSG